MKSSDKEPESPISENISKNRRRGRPLKYSPEFYNAKAQLPAGSSERSKQNCVFEYVAFEALSQDQTRYAHVLKRRTLLYELGRLWSAETIRKRADLICKDKLKTGRALALLRWLRIDRTHNHIDLARAIIKAINRFVQRQPSTTKDLVREALRICGEQVERDFSGPPK